MKPAAHGGLGGITGLHRENQGIASVDCGTDTDEAVVPGHGQAAALGAQVGMVIGAVKDVGQAVALGRHAEEAAHRTSGFAHDQGARLQRFLISKDGRCVKGAARRTA